jgi:L-lactate dehydrogenase
MVVLAMDSAGDGTPPADALVSIMERLDEIASDAVVLVAGDPVDASTCIVSRATERPADRVFGLGTCGETLELRRCISEHYEVAEESVYAYVIGHHGDKAVPVWSSVMIGGHPIVRGRVAGRRFNRTAMWSAFDRGCDRAGGSVDDQKCRDVFERTVSLCVGAVLHDQRRVLPVTAPVDGPFDVRGVCLSLPTIIGRKGVHGRILPHLSDDEIEAFRDAAHIVQEGAGAVGYEV